MMLTRDRRTVRQVSLDVQGVGGGVGRRRAGARHRGHAVPGVDEALGERGADVGADAEDDRYV